MTADPSIGFMPSQTWSFKQTIPASLGRGHRLVVKHGFLNGMVVFPGDYGFDSAYEVVEPGVTNWTGTNVTWAVWNDLGGNLVDCHGSRFNGLTGHASPPDIKYSRWCWDLTELSDGTGMGMLDQWEIFYIGGITNLAMLQATDEQDLTDADTVTAIKKAFDRWKVAYPHTIVHANIIGTEEHFYAGYDNFLRTAKPDMNMVDAYEFNSNGGTLDKHYYALKTMRDKGKLGIGSTAYAEPIPNGMWYQCYHPDRAQTQPEACLSMYSPLAYGYKALKGWIYSYNEDVAKPSGASDAIFDGKNDSVRTVYFDIVAENNRQIKLMGDTLVRLSHEGTWDVNDESGMIPAFAPGDIPNITGISSATTNDVVISKFIPLHEDFDGSASGQVYFFLLNGNTPWNDASTTPANTAQTITLTIGGGITNLEAIDLSTGAGTIETIPVTGGTVDITLDGGRGKLFKFQTGAPWVGFYNGE